MAVSLRRCRVTLFGDGMWAVDLVTRWLAWNVGGCWGSASFFGLLRADFFFFSCVELVEDGGAFRRFLPMV